MPSRLPTMLRAGDPVTIDDFDTLFAALEGSSDAPGRHETALDVVFDTLVERARAEDAVAFVGAVRRRQAPRAFRGEPSRPTVNLVGTGGGPSTFNVSTAASFVLAAAGIRVMKTGSTARTSRSGFVETSTLLGCLRDVPWETLDEWLRSIGIAFVHPARYAPVLGCLGRPARRYLNLLGPLLSPVAVDHLFVGAASVAWGTLLCRAAMLLGVERCTVFAGESGMDEVSTIGETLVFRRSPVGVDTTVLDRSTLPLTPATIEELAGCGPVQSAALLRSLLQGQASRAQLELVALNAGFVLSEAGIAPTLKAGFDEALELLKAGMPAAKLAELRAAVWPSPS